MSQAELPLLIEPDVLQASLGSAQLLVVDLSRQNEQGHIPGAVHVDYNALIHPQPPIKGMPPKPEALSTLLGDLGITPDTQVVAYDDEGGGLATRFLWTLAYAGHTRYALLNGGINAWRSEQRPTVAVPAERSAVAPYPLNYNFTVFADKQYLLDHLHDPAITIIDCRSPEEYSGEDSQTERGGHIPGAINIEWSHAIDHEHHLRFKPRDTLLSYYAKAGVTPDKEIITYCQSHRRSAHSFYVLKTLGFPRVKGYPGSWSEWGNDPDTPIES